MFILGYTALVAFAVFPEGAANETKNVTVTEGDTVVLPCGIDAVSQQLHEAWWYRLDSPKPIELVRATLDHGEITIVVKDRPAHWNGIGLYIEEGNLSLLIPAVRAVDAAMYRCLFSVRPNKLVQKIEYQLIITQRGRDTDGRITICPKLCFSSVGTSGPIDYQNPSATQESSGTHDTPTQGIPTNETTQGPLYEMPFSIPVVTLALFIVVVACLIYKLVKVKEECRSLTSKLQKLDTPTAQGHASSPGSAASTPDAC